MRQSQSESQSSWSHYAKAAAVFTLTTATYLIARTVGWLPGWFNSGKSADDSENITALSLSSTEELFLIPSLTKASEENFQTRLLQQSSQVTVANTIPDQVIKVNQLYSYSLDKIFSGSYTLLSAAEKGKKSLPNWLSMQYKMVGNFSNDIFSGVAIFETTLYVGIFSVGLQIWDVSNITSPRILSSYLIEAWNTQYIVVSEEIVYMASTGIALQILNVSNLSNPFLLSSYLTGINNLMGMVVSGTNVYLTDLYTGVTILDVSNITNPYILSNYSTNAGNWVFGLAVYGTVLYVINENPVY